MALNYDLTKVAADYDDDAVWPITNALIWGTMSIGMNSISEVARVLPSLLYDRNDPRLMVKLQRET